MLRPNRPYRASLSSSISSLILSIRSSMALTSSSAVETDCASSSWAFSSGSFTKLSPSRYLSVSEGIADNKTSRPAYETFSSSSASSSSVDTSSRSSFSFWYVYQKERSRASALPYLFDLLLLKQRILFPMQCAESIDAILVLASDFDLLLLLLLRELSGRQCGTIAGYCCAPCDD